MEAPSPLLARLRELSWSTRPAVEAADAKLSHGELLAEAAWVARTLLGERPSLEGERVTLLMKPSARWVASFLGVILAGGAVVPLSPLQPEAEIRYAVSDSGARLALLDETYHDRAPWFAGAQAILVGEPGSAALDGLPQREAGAGALVLYTSGTTGNPKGALITHANLAAQARLIGEAWGMSADDRLLHALPLHHMHGVVIALLTALLAGGSAELLDRFDARKVWEGFARSTVWMAVPTMYHKLLVAHDQASEGEREAWAQAARALRLCTSGSAALPVTLAERWRSLTGQIPLERFGMTEVGVALSNPFLKRKAGSVGLPLPGVGVRVVNEAGAAVAPGEVGEIQVQGPTVFCGYLGRSDATWAAFRGGWFVTGDMATIDDEGYVKVLGRNSVDILKSGGYKLSALEIEEAMREHPAVAEVAVVGLPDEVWGERVAAAVVLRSGMTQPVTTEELGAFCRQRLAPYKVPREIRLLEELPRNAMGKVLKPELGRRLRGA